MQHSIFISRNHLDHPLLKPNTPTNRDSMVKNPNNNQPPPPPRILGPTQNPPQEDPAWMKSPLCIQNTWHSPFRYIIMKEPFDPGSILGRNHLLNPQPVKLELKKGGVVRDPFTAHARFFMTPTTLTPPIKSQTQWKVLPYQHINSPLSSPEPQSTSDPHASPPPPSLQQWTCLTPSIAASQPKACAIGCNHGNRLGMGGERRWTDRRADNKATCSTLTCAIVSLFVIFSRWIRVRPHLHLGPSVWWPSLTGLNKF